MQLFICDRQPSREYLLLYMIALSVYGIACSLFQVLKTRTMLTEVLLEVTSQEIEKVAVEVYGREKAKAFKGRGPG